MKKPLKIIEYDNLIHKQIKEDRKIGEHIFLLDEYQLSPVRDYEFTAPEPEFRRAAAILQVLQETHRQHALGIPQVAAVDKMTCPEAKPGSFTPPFHIWTPDIATSVGLYKFSGVPSLIFLRVYFTFESRLVCLFGKPSHLKPLT